MPASAAASRRVSATDRRVERSGAGAAAASTRARSSKTRRAASRAASWARTRSAETVELVCGEVGLLGLGRVAEAARAQRVGERLLGATGIVVGVGRPLGRGDGLVARLGQGGEPLGAGGEVGVGGVPELGLDLGGDGGDLHAPGLLGGHHALLLEAGGLAAAGELVLLLLQGAQPCAATGSADSASDCRRATSASAASTCVGHLAGLGAGQQLGQRDAGGEVADVLLADQSLGLGVVDGLAGRPLGLGVDRAGAGLRGVRVVLGAADRAATADDEGLRHLGGHALEALLAQVEPLLGEQVNLVDRDSERGPGLGELRHERGVLGGGRDPLVQVGRLRLRAGEGRLGAERGGVLLAGLLDPLGQPGQGGLVLDELVLEEGDAGGVRLDAAAQAVELLLARLAARGPRPPRSGHRRGCG